MERRGSETGGDQFYVTHCDVADSVLHHPGYTVRAASVSDPAALDAAFQYPPYELPIDLWRDLPTPESAPCRLARTKFPKRGGVWAVHSAYLEKDTVGRDRSYFSHLLLFSDAGTAEVLRSWGGDGWVKSYPPGAPKALPGGAGLPAGGLVSDAALTAFLGEGSSGPTDLSRTVCPERLRASATLRRELFVKMLRALLLLAEEEDAARRRLYVHAEPGLVALLLYGAVRLLPPAVTDDLTFTTFEPHQRNLRDYKLAEVVGTYTGSPDRGLDPDLGTTRGIALDTFAPNRSSAELRGPAVVEGLDALVDLATAGDWELLPAVRHAIGGDPGGLHKAGGALARARGLARVDAGTATVDDLLALQADKPGAEGLKSRAPRVWPLVKPAALARADVRAAFRELLAQPEHARELWEDGVEALLKEDFRRWDACWSVLRGAAGPDGARRLLDKLVGREKNEGKMSRLPTDTRHKLRAACADVNQLPCRALLVPTGLGELEPLLRAQPDWAGYTAFVLLAGDAFDRLAHVPAPDRDKMRARARDFLLAAPAAAVAAYVRAARPFLDDQPGLLAALFTPHSDEASGLMDRLLAADVLEPNDWLNVCNIVGLVQGEWGEFLLEKHRLAHLLVGLGGDGAGRDVWGGYLELLTPALLSPDLSAGAGDDPAIIHDWERKVHAHLRLAADRLATRDARLVQALPPGGVAKLFAANALVKWAGHPSSIPRDAPDEVPHACDAFGVEPLGLVRVAYKNLGAQISLPEHAEELAPIVGLFQACFPTDGTFNTARRVASAAVRLSDDCPGRGRGALQAHLILACVPDMNFAALIEDAKQHPALDPFAVEQLRQRIARPAKKTPVAKPTPEPAPAGAPFEDEEGADGDEEDAPVIERRSKAKKTPYKKAKGPGCLGALLVLAVGVAGVVAALV